MCNIGFIEGELLSALLGDFTELFEGFASGMNKHFGETNTSSLASGDVTESGSG